MKDGWPSLVCEAQALPGLVYVFLVPVLFVQMYIYSVVFFANEVSLQAVQAVRLDPPPPVESRSHLLK